MTQSNPLELAKQGDPQAIASLMNRSLQPKGLTARAERRGDHLQVLLEAAQVPNRQVLTSFVQTGLQKLGISTIQTVEILGKQASATNPAWSEEITLAPPAPPAPPAMPPVAAPVSPPAPPPLPRNPNIVAEVEGDRLVIQVPETQENLEGAQLAGEDRAPTGREQPIGLDDELDNEEIDDTSTLLASLSEPVDETPPIEPPPQFDALAADLDAVSLPSTDDGIGGDEPIDLGSDEFSEAERPAAGGFVLPALQGNELPTVTDSLTIDELQDFDASSANAPGSGRPLASDTGFHSSIDEQVAYVPPDDFDQLRGEKNDLTSDVALEPGSELSEPGVQYFPPDDDTTPEPDGEYIYEPEVNGEPISAEGVADDEELVEERSSLPATGWFAAGLLGILIFGLLGYSLFSSNFGGVSLFARLMGISSESPAPEASVTPLPAATASVAASPTPTAANTAPLQAANALEQKIAGLEANAQSVDDWNLIAGQWQAAIALLQQVPAGSPDGAAAQEKLAVFQQKLAAAQQRASQPVAANTPSSTTTTTIAGNVACQAVQSQADSQPIELTNLQIQPGQGGNVMIGCLTNHTDQAIAQVSVSYEATSAQDPNAAQGGLSQIATTPLQPRETVPFTGSFTLNPDLNSVRIESIFWTPVGTQEPQRIPTELVLAP